MFGRKGDDFVFKIGDTINSPVMIPAEEAISLLMQIKVNNLLISLVISMLCIKR